MEQFLLVSPCPACALSGVSAFSGPSGWDNAFSLNDINTPGQFGKFDLAAVTGPNFNGGSPDNGIPRGAIFSFDFVLAGSNLDTLTEMSFLSLLPSGSSQDNVQDFIVRWQRAGSNGRGSDVGIPGASPVPEPSALLLFGVGLTGLGAFVRKRS